MDKKKIQLLLNKHGKSISIVARDLSVSYSVVSRTISNNRSGSPIRVRLYIPKILGLKPSEVFNLELKNRFFEDHVYFTSELVASHG